MLKYFLNLFLVSGCLVNIGFAIDCKPMVKVFFADDSKAAFIKTLNKGEFQHPYLSAHTHAYIKRVENIISQFNEWQKYEIMYYVFKNLNKYKPLIKSRNLKALGKTQTFETYQGQTFSYDPRNADLYWYGYPDLVAKSNKFKNGIFDRPELFSDYTNHLGQKNIIFTSLYEHGGKDGRYDVTTQMKIASELGGNKKYSNFLNLWRDKGYITQDFIFSHLDPHLDELSLKNFIYLDDLPMQIGPPFQKEKGGAMFIRYRDKKSGNEWDLELDDANARGHHYRPYIDPKSKKLVYMLHLFKDNQFALNNFEPSTWDLHLNALGHWISQGISIQRNDATLFLASKKDQNTMGSNESLAMVELIMSFAQNLRPGLKVTNEVVGGAAIAKKYAGENVDYGGIVTGSHGNMDYAFQISTAVKFAIVLEDFSDVYRAIKELDNIEFPKDYLSLKFTDTHDHVSIGFLSPKNRVLAKKIAQERGGDTTYSDVNMAIRVADLIKRNPAKKLEPKRSLLFIKTLMGLGNSIIYSGDEFGKRTDFAFAYQVAKRELSGKLAFVKSEIKKSYLLLIGSKGDLRQALLEQIDEFKKEIKLLHEAETALRNQPKNIPPAADSVLRKTVYDPRWTKRAPVTSAEMTDLMNHKADPDAQKIFDGTTNLSRARMRSAALYTPSKMAWLETNIKDIGSWVLRKTPEERGEIVDEVLVLVNPTSSKRNVPILGPETLSQKYSWQKLKFYEIEQMRYLVEGVDFTRQDGQISFNIAADEALWIQLRN